MLKKGELNIFYYTLFQEKVVLWNKTRLFWFGKFGLNHIQMVSLFYKEAPMPKTRTVIIFTLYLKIANQLKVD